MWEYHVQQHNAILQIGRIDREEAQAQARAQARAEKAMDEKEALKKQEEMATERVLGGGSKPGQKQQQQQTGQKQQQADRPEAAAAVRPEAAAAAARPRRQGGRRREEGLRGAGQGGLASQPVAAVCAALGGTCALLGDRDGADICRGSGHYREGIMAHQQPDGRTGWDGIWDQLRCGLVGHSSREGDTGISGRQLARCVAPRAGAHMNMPVCTPYSTGETNSPPRVESAHEPAFLSPPFECLGPAFSPVSDGVEMRGT